MRTRRRALLVLDGRAGDRDPPRPPGPGPTRAESPLDIRPEGHIGPLIPPSFRTRQKWIMISSATASGIATQCST